MSNPLLDMLRANRETLISERATAYANLTAVTAEAVAESRDALTEDEQAGHEYARSIVAALDDDIEALDPRIQELEELDARARQAANVPHAPNIIPSHDDEVIDARQLARVGVGEVRDRAMRIIEAEDKRPTAYLRSDQKDRIGQLVSARGFECDGDEIARRMILTENDAYRSAYVKTLTPDGPLTWNNEERAAMAAFNEFRSMTATVTTQGGFGVPVLIDPTINLTSQGHVPIVLQVCDIKTITTDQWKGVSSAGVTWSYDDELEEVSDDTPTLAQPTVAIHEARGFVPFSIRLGMDYPDLAGELNKLLMAGYTDKLASVTATGTGTTQPFGIITAIDATAASEVTPTTDGALNAVDLDKVWNALPERYRDQATWMMSTDVGSEVAPFGNSNALAYVTTDLTQNYTTLLRGRPVLYSDYFPTFIGSTGANNLIVVGDFSQYVFAQRAGVTTELVPHMFATGANRPSLSRALLMYARNGGDSINDNGFRLLQNQ